MIAGSPNRRSCGPLAPYVPKFGGDSARHGRSLPLSAGDGYGCPSSVQSIISSQEEYEAAESHLRTQRTTRVEGDADPFLAKSGAPLRNRPGSRPARTRPVRPASAPSASRRRGPAGPVPGCARPRRGPHAAPCRWRAGPLRAKAARSTWTVSFPEARIPVWLALELWLKDPAIALADTTEPTDVEWGWCGLSVFSQAPADGHALGRRPEGNRELAHHIRKGT